MNRLWREADGKLAFECPGCGFDHALSVDPAASGPTWGWNGDMERPTFTPSIRVRWTWGERQEARCCHSFVRDGRIQFLGDCTHKLAGQTVDLADVAGDGGHP